MARSFAGSILPTAVIGIGRHLDNVLAMSLGVKCHRRAIVLKAWGAAARSFTSVTTTESAVWKPGAVVSLSNKAKGTVVETLADSLEFVYKGDNGLAVTVDVEMFERKITGHLVAAVPVAGIVAYPGCAWTPEGIVRFNAEYLVPTLARTHPGVEVYFGTINTNRFDVIDSVLSDSLMSASVKGFSFQAGSHIDFTI